MTTPTLLGTGLNEKLISSRVRCQIRQQRGCRWSRGRYRVRRWIKFRWQLRIRRRGTCRYNGRRVIESVYQNHSQRRIDPVSEHIWTTDILHLYPHICFSSIGIRLAGVFSHLLFYFRDGVLSFLVQHWLRRSEGWSLGWISIGRELVPAGFLFQTPISIAASLVINYKFDRLVANPLSIPLVSFFGRVFLNPME